MIFSFSFFPFILFKQTISDWFIALSLSFFLSIEEDQKPKIYSVITSTLSFLDPSFLPFVPLKAFDVSLSYRVLSDIFPFFLWLSSCSGICFSNSFLIVLFFWEIIFWKLIIMEITIMIYSLRVFHISVSWWFFTGVWVRASFLMFPGLVSGFWPISAMLSFG